MNDAVTSIAYQKMIAISESLGLEFDPMCGFQLEVYASLHDKDLKTIRRWVEKYDIPFRQPGDVRFFDPLDWRESFPKRVPSETKKPRQR